MFALYSLQIERYKANLKTIMTTIISPNIKKESVRIDPQGNVINARTKQVIEENKAEYTPTEATQSPVTNETPKVDTIADKINQMVEAKIKEKIDAIVAQRVEEALKNL